MCVCDSESISATKSERISSGVSACGYGSIYIESCSLLNRGVIKIWKTHVRMAQVELHERFDAGGQGGQPGRQLACVRGWYGHVGDAGDENS